MRPSHWYATFVAGIAFAGSISTLAQGQLPPTGGRPAAAPAAQAAPQGNAAPRGTNVAVIDIKFIFENYKSFKVAMDTIKKDYDAFEAEVRGVEANLRKQIEQLKSMPAGSPEFKQLEQQVATTRTQVQLDINNKQKERVEEEARIYHNAYQTLELEIKKMSDRYGIDLVLQFSSAEIDPTKPDTVIRGLNRLVVFHNQLDITPNILQELNRNAPQQPVAPNQPVRQSNQPQLGGPRQPSGAGQPTQPQVAPRPGAPGFPNPGFPKTQQR